MTSLLFHAVLAIGLAQQFASATITCTPGDTLLGDSYCVSKYRIGSSCDPDTSTCTNPFASGCLRNILGPANFPAYRTCNSDDDVDANGNAINSTTKLCAPSPFDYEEVRILSQNWESAMLSSWIMQIVLSELLGVPTTMETSMPDDEASFNFYDPSMRFSYSKRSYDYDALRASLEHGIVSRSRPTMRRVAENTRAALTLCQRPGTDRRRTWLLPRRRD